MGATMPVPGGLRRYEAVMTLEEVEGEHIRRVLEFNAGNVSSTARMLGIHRRSLQRKIARHRLDRGLGQNPAVLASSDGVDSNALLC